MSKRSIFFITSLPLLGLILTGCLKTRAQLLDEPATERGTPSKVQDVQPQGQYVIDEIKSELTRMAGRIEDLERAQKTSATPEVPQEEIKKLEARIIELEQAQASLIEAFKKSSEGPTSTTGGDPVELFERGKNQYEAKNYEAAIESFSAYLKSSKAKSATERAVFLRAESHYQLKEFKKAIVDYSKMIEKYPNSARMPMVLYKIGLSFEALNMKDDALSFYQELVDKYPKSQEAKKVRPKLK